MRIELRLAMTEGDIPKGLCALCEAEFEARPVFAMEADEPHWRAVCEPCLLALDQRLGEDGVEADWPTFEEYDEATRAYPKPMMTSEELAGLTEAEYDFAYELSFIGQQAL